MPQITNRHFTELLRSSAGGEELTDVGGQYLDRSFDDLGYDSVAVLEVVSRLEREYLLKLPDEEVAELGTPRGLLDLANSVLAAPAGS